MEEVMYPCIRYVRDLIEGALEGVENPPALSIGGTNPPKPSQVIVREMPSSVVIQDEASSACMGGRAMGRYSVAFSVPVEIGCQRRGLEDASAAVLSWFERIASAVAADRTLGGLCEHAKPYMGRAGTGRDGALYSAYALCGIEVKASLRPARSDG